MSVSIPNEWLCPITLSMMRDPVIAEDGHTYEREAITQWFATSNKSPKTNEPLYTMQLIPNIALRNIIQDFLAANPSALIKSAVPDYIPSPLQLSYTKYDDKMHISVKAMGAPQRTPAVILAIVDNSGSMGEVADSEMKESFGYTRMDLVKHTIRTMAAVLGPNDMLGIVTYSTQARVVVRPVQMNAAGKARISAALETIEPDSQTNIYDGIRQAVAIVNSPELAGKNIVGLLLTDGFPNINPPRGFDYALATLELKNRWTLHTFGFGYKLDSALLHRIAQWGNGIFGFIPDCSMVATIFINFLANVLSTAATDSKITYGSTTFHTGPIMYGQTRDFVLPYVDGTPLLNDIPGFEDKLDTSFADSRQKYMDAINQALTVASSMHYTAAASILKTAADALKIAPFVSDINGPDPAGQIGMAPLEPYYVKWGEHYMRSYLSAQRLQQCMNFKDPGLQVYGGELFHQLQTVGDKAFDELPPPVPSGAPPKATYANPVTSLRSLTQSFNNPSGGCFHGNCEVLMADFTRCPIKNIQPGASVWTPSGPASVIALVTCNTKNKSQPMSQIDGLSITPWHPIRMKGTWSFPASLYFYTERMLQTVYNLVLDKGHIVNVEGFDCVTLGHTFTEPVVAHPFFGSNKVIEDLKKVAGWAEGRPTFTNLVAVKDETGIICGWTDSS